MSLRLALKRSLDDSAAAEAQRQRQPEPEPKTSVSLQQMQTRCPPRPPQPVPATMSLRLALKRSLEDFIAAEAQRQQPDIKTSVVTPSSSPPNAATKRRGWPKGKPRKPPAKARSPAKKYRIKCIYVNGKPVVGGPVKKRVQPKGRPRKVDNPETETETEPEEDEASTPSSQTGPDRPRKRPSKSRQLTVHERFMALTKEEKLVHAPKVYSEKYLSKHSWKSKRMSYMRDAHLEIKSSVSDESGTDESIIASSSPKAVLDDHEMIRLAGEISDEAVVKLQEHGAIGKVCRNISQLTHYPDVLTRVRRCHLRALHNICPETALQACEKVKHNEPQKVKAFLPDKSKGEVFRLRNSHWVALTADHYLDDRFYFEVKNHSVASYILSVMELEDLNL